jgi:hypothetical protein
MDHLEKEFHGEDIDRYNDMLYLRFTLKWPLRKIGNKYNITRERVRQILGGNTGHFTEYTFRIEEAKRNGNQYPDLTNREFATFFGIPEALASNIRAKNRHAMLGQPKMGKEIEEFISKTLIDAGIPNDLMPHKHEYDILTKNGARIEVKSCWTSKKFGTCVSPAWRFRINDSDNSDFYVCVIVDKVKEIFVIPIEILRGRTQIRFCFPSSYRNEKYLKYHNNFDLIKNFQQ